MGKNAQRRRGTVLDRTTSDREWIRLEPRGRVAALPDSIAMTRSVTGLNRAERRAIDRRHPAEMRMRQERAETRYRKRSGEERRPRPQRSPEAIARKEIRRARKLALWRSAA